MDTSALLPVVVGGTIALVSQIVGTNRAGRVAQVQIDFDRWEGWRREAANAWAEVMSVLRILDQPFEDLATCGDDELARIRHEAGVAVASLDRLSALTLDHRVAEWSAQLARQVVALVAALPTHPNCDDEQAAERFRQLRHILHSPFEWNDGTSTTQVERLRDVLRKAADPPVRERTVRRLWWRRWRR
jgi:hypothetical protein